MAVVKPLPNYSCGASKAISEFSEENKLMQLFMGLHDGYDQVRSQILLLDPLPSVNKAYSMILRVESQHQVVSTLNETNEGAVFFSKQSSNNKRD